MAVDCKHFNFDTRTLKYYGPLTKTTWLGSGKLILIIPGSVAANSPGNVLVPDPKYPVMSLQAQLETSGHRFNKMWLFCPKHGWQISQCLTKNIWKRSQFFLQNLVFCSKFSRRLVTNIQWFNTPCPATFLHESRILNMWTWCGTNCRNVDMVPAWHEKSERICCFAENANILFW